MRKITESGLTIEDTVVGEGAAAAAGRDVTVHYAGWLADGTQFDSSKEKNDPFQFTLAVFGASRIGVQHPRIGVRSALFNHDGSVVATLGESGVVRLWETADLVAK